MSARGLALVLVSIGTVVAGTITVPGVGEGDINNVDPFGLGSEYFAPFITGRYQQVYSATMFGGVQTITGLAFRLDEGTGSAVAAGTSQLSNVLITLSTTSKAVGGLDSVFAHNLTSAATTVYSGALTFAWSASSGSARPFDLQIPLQQAFLYNAALGNLLLDVTIIGGNIPGSSTPAFDATSHSAVTSRVWLNSSSPTGWQGTDGSTDLELVGGVLASKDIGLVTQFQTSVPEPASALLLLAGLSGIGALSRRRRT